MVVSCASGYGMHTTTYRVKKTDLETSGVIDPWSLVVVRARELEIDKAQLERLQVGRLCLTTSSFEFHLQEC